MRLLTRLAKTSLIEKDNQALRDQFATAEIPASALTPANIVDIPAPFPGGPSFIDRIIIDKGNQDGIKVGQNVVYKDNLIGKVVKSSPRMAVVDLLNHKGTSFTVRAVKSGSLGIGRGTGGEKFILENVLLSYNLEKGELVVTRGPNPLVVGRIIDVSKKASALFQSAEIESLVDIRNLKMVFIQSGG